MKMKKMVKKTDKNKIQKSEVLASAAPSEKSGRAVLKWLRSSPRKVRPVLDAIRKKPVGSAWIILGTINKKAARLAEKALKSAVANAKVLELDEDRLYISDARADGGPTLKRFQPRSMGRADRILKRTTHITLVVKENIKKLQSSFQETGEAEQLGEAKSKAPKKKVLHKKKAASAGSK